MRSPLLPLSQSHSLQLLSPSYRLFQGEKDRKPQSQLEAQRDSEESLQKCKFCLQDQQTQGESSQSTPSRSLKMKYLHEEYKVHTSSIQCAEKPISPRATSSNPNSSRSRYYCTSRTLEESSPSNQHLNCFFFFSFFIFSRDWQNSFSYQQKPETVISPPYFLE